jgi:hypothetical protein
MNPNPSDTPTDERTEELLKRWTAWRASLSDEERAAEDARDAAEFAHAEVTYGKDLPEWLR